MPDEVQPNADIIPGTDIQEEESGLGNGEETVEGEGEGTPQPGESEFDPNKWAMTYKGSQVIPRDRQHLVNLAQQGYGYSKAMEGIKRERTEMEGSREKYSKYDALEQALQANPEMANKIWGMVNQQQGGEGNGDQPGLSPEVASKLQEFDQFKTEYRATQADNSLKSEIDQMKRDYPDETWDVDSGEGTLESRILQHALDNKILDLRVAYKDMMWDQMQSKIKSTTLAKQKAAKIAAKKAGIVDGGAPGQGTRQLTGGYKAGDSWNSLTDKVMQKY